MNSRIVLTVCLALAAGMLLAANQVLTFDVPAGTTQTYTAQIGAGFDVVKTGAGKLVVSNDNNTAFSGTVTVKGGILEAQSGLLSDHRVFGANAANTITVEKGAQLITRVPGPKAQGDKQFPNNLFLAGAGPDGSGALRAYRYSGVSGSQGNCDALFGNVALTDDATVRMEARIGFSNGTVNFNGHRLSLYKGGNVTFMLYGGTTWNAGTPGAELIVTNGTEATLQGTVKFAGDGTVVVANDSRFYLWGPALTCPWKIRFDGAGAMNLGSGNNDSANNISGPIEMKGNVFYGTYSSAAGMRQHLSGVISGAGRFTKSGIHTLYLDNTANTWTGGTTIGGNNDDLTSVLVPKAPGSLPGWNQDGKVALNANGVLALPTANWTRDDAAALVAHATVAATGAFAPDTSTGDAAWTGDWFTKKARLAHVDAGRFETDTALPDGSQIWVKNGTLALTGAKQRHVSQLNVPSGTLEVDGGYLHALNATMRIGGSSSAGARLVLGNGGAFMGLNAPIALTGLANVNLPTFEIGSTGTKPAVLEIDGGSFTGKVAAVSGAKAVYSLRDGDFTQMSGPTADGFLSSGANGYGYLDQTGGRFVVRAHTGLMTGGSTGMYEMKGGTFDYLNPDGVNFALSRGYGWGEFYQTGGTFDPYTRNGRSFYMGIQSYSDPTGGVAIATLDGPDAYMKVNNVDMGQRTTNFVSILNLNAGVLETKYIEHAAATRKNCPGYVNFNGGTFRALDSNSDIFGSGTKVCARATVFGKGAVIDTAGKTLRVNAVPLSAPSGKGVASITIPASAAQTGYFGPPEVKITGDGAGATAHCLFDAATGAIGPVVVTSPGWGYTTAKAVIRNAARTGDVQLEVKLAEQVGGGLVKKGAGTLELACRNTYTGATRVEAGVLKLNVAQAIPAANDLVLAGGSVECAAGVAASFAHVGGVGEISSGALTATQGLVFDANDIATGGVFAVTGSAQVNLPANADVRILNADKMPGGTTYVVARFPAGTFASAPKMADGGDWTCTVSADGSTLSVVRKASVSLDVSRPRIGTEMAVAFGDDGVPTGTESVAWYRSSATDRTYGSAPHATGAAYTPAVADCEHWFKVVVSDADGVRFEREFFFSRLPVCYIEVANGAVPSVNKEEHDATIRIQGNGAYAQQYEGATTIKVRGNSTKGYPKKPWKLKLGKKTDVFKLGGGVKNKHWVLLANYLDECLMRNTIGSRLADALGVANMKTEWVDVVFNGSYNGCYQLCQHIRIAEERVNVYDWENAAGKVAEGFAETYPMSDEDLDAFTAQLEQNFSWVTSDSVTWGGNTMKASKAWKKFTNDISGGYLWEMSSEYDEVSKFIVTSGVMTVKTMLNKPEFLASNPAMMAECRKIWQDYWDACTSTNGYNAAGRHYSELCDVDSMVGYWLTMVTMENSDSTKKSRYAYKDQGGKIVWGPVWDFDWGCGSPVTVSQNSDGSWKWSSATNTFGVAKSSGTDDQGVTKGGFYREWADDPWFCQKLVEAYWAKVHPYFAEMLKPGGTYDQYVALLAEAGVANEKKWKNRVGFSGPDGDVARYRRFLTDRLDWMDKQFANVSTLMAAVKSDSTAQYTRSTATTTATFASGLGAATAKAQSRETEIQDLEAFKDQDVVASVTSGAGTHVAVYVNGLLAGRAALDGGKAAVRVPAAMLTAQAGDRNVIAFDAEDASGRVLKRNYALVSPKEWTNLATETNKVDYAWLLQIDPSLAASGTPADFEALAETAPSPLGKSRPPSYDWIAGTDPAKPDDELKVTKIEIVDGEVKLTWTPDLGPARKYMVKGAATVDGAYTAPLDATHRFFKVSVER